jgi:peptidoglycan hydrolase-like protein with peptidoglycan-binding domain
MRGFLHVALILLLACASVPAMAERVALVIGAGAYRHAPPLPNATNDASDLAGTLRELGFRVDLLLDPDRTAMEQAVERFGTAARGADAALFFYAGHAIEVQGRNWIIPVSAELRTPQQLRFQALELEAVTEQIQQVARFSLIILDACRDNPFRQRWPAASRSAAGQGLARISPAVGTLVVFSTAPGAVAEDGRGRNSPFTTALLRHLPTPGLEVRPLFSEVRRSVREATGGTQVPWEESSLEGSFYFRAAAPPAPAPPAPGPPPQAVAPAPVFVLPQMPAAPGNDVLAWQFVMNSRNPADFDTFLQSFPDSVFAPFARNRLAELRAQPDRGIVTAPPPAPVPPPAPQIAALPVPRPADPPPDPNRPMSRAEAQEAQRLLSAMGFDAGPADGVIGPRSREALEAFALAADLPASTDFRLATLERLRGPAPSPERRRAALAALAPPPAPPAPAPAPAVARPPPPAIVPTPASPVVPAGPVPFRCPPSGLRLVMEDGPARTYRGTAPDDPETCLIGSAAQPARFLFGLFGQPVEDERRRREGIRAIFPAAPGRSATFIYVVPAGGGSTSLRDTWEVLRRETMELESGPRATLVYRRERRGEFGNSHLSREIYWWDLATGAWLRREVEQIRGTSGNRPFRAVRVEGG